MELGARMGRLVGDVLSAASFLSYSGPFNQEYRCVLLQQWNTLVQQYDIPRTQNFSVLSLMADSAEVSIIVENLSDLFLTYYMLLLCIGFRVDPARFTKR